MNHVTVYVCAASEFVTWLKFIMCLSELLAMYQCVQNRQEVLEKFQSENNKTDLFNCMRIIDY